MAAASAARADSQTSRGSDFRMDHDSRRISVPEPADTSDPARKRKTSESPSNTQNSQRQKITRACDYCKGKKTRCTGTLPCLRCTRLSLSCEYNAAYSRGLPPEPLPAPSSSLVKPAPSSRRPLAARGVDTSASRRPSRHSPNNSISSDNQPPKSDPDISPGDSPEPVATDLEGNYLGPASGISFINRVWGRLRQDETSALPDGLPNESSKSASVFTFGDKPYTHYQDTGFTLPPFDKALELVGIYFDFSMVTYRFLHRGSVEDWLRQVYENNVSFSNPPPGNIVARTAVILMIFAVATLYEELHPGISTDGHNGSERWYVASKYMSSMESGPPRLETIQARLGQCLYLLSSSRANECWYSFGTALQLVAALGLHRQWYAKMLKTGSTFLEQELRKRIFWSAYTLDKYLSIMFGRPRLLHDEDIDQEFPDQANDEDMSQEDPVKRTGSPDGMMTASILHYRLARILEEISRQFYTINPKTRDPPLETAARLIAELEKWKESAPPLFNSVRATSLIPPLRRQSQVLQLAYSHAMIHATRSFLLNDVVDLRRMPSASHPMVNSHVQKCVDAAEDAMTLVDGLGKQGILIQSFWFTHYVCFCAIIVVYIHTIQQHRLSSFLGPPTESIWDGGKLHYLFNLAETCHQHLAEATRKNSPSRRYSIILEELRREVHRQIGSHFQSNPHTTIPDAQPKPEYQDTFKDQRTFVHAPVGQPISFDSTASYPPVSGDLQMPDLVQEPISPSEEIEFLENLEGSSWWSQLDSWAFSSISNDPSTLTF
ncbi:Transcription factor [Aspergillus sp. HF37]|nr:Transcription factor [Aspergillus sp. HF37]